MKILFISDVYFPRVNGVSTSMQTFRHELHAQGHTVHLIAPEYQTSTTDESDIWRIPARSIPMDPEDRFMRYGAGMQHLERLRQERYDVIHVQTPFVAHYLGVKMASLLDIPCVETYHTFFEEYLYHYIPLVPRKLMRLAARRFSRHQGNSLDGMVVPSNPMLQVLKDYGITTPTQVIPTGIESARFTPGNRTAFREKQGIAQDRPVLLFLGRVAHEKNIGFLLKAVACVKKEIPDVLFVIAGEGPARAALEQEAKTQGLNDNVQFIGYLDRQTELNDCYRAADIFIFASRTETQGLVLLEAMAQGTPVVSTAELGTLDVLKNGAGVWVAREELADFSGKIIRMLTDGEARISLGDLGREYAREWSASRQAERMAEFYSTVINSRKTNAQNIKNNEISILEKPCNLTT
jgi:glycosyltransferase involved in cell wall biosynthesis